MSALARLIVYGVPLVALAYHHPIVAPFWVIAWLACAIATAPDAPWQADE